MNKRLLVSSKHNLRVSYLFPLRVNHLTLQLLNRITWFEIRLSLIYKKSPSHEPVFCPVKQSQIIKSISIGSSKNLGFLVKL